jgi:hypothetical protein
VEDIYDGLVEDIYDGQSLPSRGLKHDLTNG